jgi:hypothetical protein
MIEMKCPACGAEGRAPKSKVNTRLVCRKCLKVFHLTPGGRAVPGEPPIAGTTSTATPEELAAADRTKNVDEFFERLSKGLISWRTVGVVVGIIVVSYAATLVLSRHGESLQDRVTKVAQAAVNGEVHPISECASEGTKTDAIQWYESVRPQCDELKQRLGSSKLRVDIEMSQEGSDSNAIDVVARVSSDESLDRKGSALPDPTLSLTSPASTQTLSLPMTWRSEGWSGWRLDGRRTLLGSLAARGPVVPPGTEQAKPSDRAAP